MTKEELVNHVIDSFWLDLAYDEESREMLAKRGLSQLLQEAEKQRTIDPLPDEEDPSVWFKHFKKLKVVRVLDGLDLDEASREYADSNVEPVKRQFQQDKFELVRDRASQRRKNLDTITWRCSAAIDRILDYFPGNNAKESKKRPWATLLALYHSELCASASEEVSFGWARRHHFLLKKSAVGFPVFLWTANHNVSRGFNHINRHLDAVKGLDFDIDKFNNTVKELSKEFKSLEKNIVPLLYRLLYLPALLTLAQSLEDLQRHSERRYYLQKGKNIATKKLRSEYWKQIFSLQLSLTEIDTGLIGLERDNSKLKFMNHDHLSPRTIHLLTLKENQAAEIKAKAHLRKSESTSPEVWLDNWGRTTFWLLSWHSAEPPGFHRRLRATAEFLMEFLELANKSRTRNPTKENLAERKRIAIAAVRVLTETRRFMAFLTSKHGLSTVQSRSLKCLLVPKPPKANEVNVMDLPEIWRSGSCLLKCLNILKEQGPLKKELKDWQKDLLKALNWPKGKIEYQFRSEIDHLKLFPDTNLLKRFCSQQVNNKGRHCKDYCATEAISLTSPVQSISTTSDGQERRRVLKKTGVAEYQTYRWAMHSQQKRFLEYLKFRTAKERNYRAGEADVKSPEFELISLRRWNSFSPNLGSRAAASVGGGYLVRLWHERRYIGIAVDPGYNFLENLFNEGFTIADIDIIVVTHAHPDHTENLTNLFTLLFERNKRMTEEGNESNDISAPMDHRVFLLLTEGVFERYQSLLRPTKSYVRDVVVLKAIEWRGSEASSGIVRIHTDEQWNCYIEIASNSESDTVRQEYRAAEIVAKRTWHDDLTGHDSIGIVIKYWGKSKKAKAIGILGDSKYHSELYRDYSDCSVLVSHLGSFISKSYYKSMDERGEIGPEEWIKMIRNEDHLYLPGLMRLICDLGPKRRSFPLMVLSEFGEELRGGLRKDLAKRLAYGVWSNYLPIVPADVGLRIDIENKLIFCSVCHRYLKPNQIEVESVLPNEEALAFVCEDCRLLRGGELTKLLEDWCTTGRPVIQLEAKRGSIGEGPDERHPPLHS